MRRMKRWKSGEGHPIKNLMWMIQEGKCFYCGCNMEKKMRNTGYLQCLTVDHLIPRSLGGSRVMVAACWQCNHKKNDNPPSIEELNRFKALMLTPEHGHYANGHQQRAIEEVNFWLTRKYGKKAAAC